MAYLHEFQAKLILGANGIAVPRGGVASSADEARKVATLLGDKVVVKAQIHSTSRAAAGGIRFASNVDEAVEIATKMLGSEIGGNYVEQVLIDERLAINHEFYLGFIVDDRKKRPTLLLSESGGSGIEERAGSMKTLVCSIRHEPTNDELLHFVSNALGSDATTSEALASTLLNLYRSAKSCEARTAEINPFVRLDDGCFVAADARISADDYAVFRHSELDIDIARELGHTPTKLERIAWNIEKEDFRGTFFFVEILDDAIRNPQSAIRIGFHGGGGGGSMASLDAAQQNGLAPACYVDTSGNPPASKVYRAAKIILSIPGIRGYFLSGSGVASQEQFGLARAVIKAFREVRPAIPAVLRLGGNGEDYAKKIVEKYAADLPAPIEAYQKRHSADFCAARLHTLIKEFEPQRRQVAQEKAETHTAGNVFSDSYSFSTRTGTIHFDYEVLDVDSAKLIVDSCPQKILTLSSDSKPVLAISNEDAERGKCSECLACEFASLDLGLDAVRIDFPILGFE